MYHTVTGEDGRAGRPVARRVVRGRVVERNRSGIVARTRHNTQVGPEGR